jgi:hypothetical protein
MGLPTGILRNIDAKGTPVSHEKVWVYRIRHVTLLSPQFRITGTTDNHSPRKKAFVAIVNGIVRLMCRADEELGIEDVRIAVFDVIRAHRVHVMNYDAIMDLKPGCSQVTTLISENYEVSEASPLGRAVERLVHPPFVTESGLSNLTSKRQITKPFFERRNP